MARIALSREEEPLTVLRVLFQVSLAFVLPINIISKLVLRFPHDKDSPLGAQNKN